MTPEISNVLLDDLLLLLHRRYGYDFSHYSKASLLRRTEKFMSLNAMPLVEELGDRLCEDPDLFQDFLETLTVNVTEMFRDPEFYKMVRNKVLPTLASYPQIKIWHAGCSTGEEVYSMCILLYEAGLLDRTHFYATDINRTNLEKAMTGVMPLHLMKTYTANYLQTGGEADFSDYYTAMYDHVIFKKEIRSRVAFLQHNLVTDQSFNEFQLIICRNVMIYFDKFLQNQALSLFHQSLCPLGFLALGLKESLRFSSIRNHFSVVDAGTKIFRRNE